MKTCPHSVHSLRAVSSLLMVGVSRSVKTVAGGKGRDKSDWSAAFYNYYKHKAVFM